MSRRTDERPDGRPVPPTPNDTRERLTGLLRQGDPASDGLAPSPYEVAALRGRIVATATAGPVAGGRWVLLPVAAVLAVGALTVTMGFATLRLGDGTPPRLATAEPTARPDTAEPPRTRQVHFETPGGTRVVWVLNPDLDV